MKDKIRIATRNSPLALWQANFVKDRLLALYSEMHVEIIGMTTKGDQLLDSPLAKLGGKGLFVKELENAMLNSDADIAVHSMKDVGVHLPDGLGIHAILERHSPFDAFVSNHFKCIADMPAESVIGTCSLRRISQLKHRFPHLVFKPLRGNVNTRLRKLDDGEFDAIVLAESGLVRLGMASRVAEVLPAAVSLPAIAQGALGIECRNDPELIDILKPLIDVETTQRVTAERAVNEVLNGSCQTPIAAYAVIDGDELILNAAVGDLEENRLLCAGASGKKDMAHAIGIQVGEILLEKGADVVLAKASL